MTDDPGRETRVIDLHGRAVVIRKLIDTQIVILAREAQILQRDDVDVKRKLAGVDKFFTVLESAVVAESDKAYLEQLMLEGKLDLRELTTFVTAFNEPEVAEKAPAAKVRRARTPAKR